MTMKILTTKIAADMIAAANLTLATSQEAAAALLEQGVPDPRADWAGHIRALEVLASLLAENKKGHTYFGCGWERREALEEALEGLQIPLPPGVGKEMREEMRKYTDLFARYARHLCLALGFDLAAFERLGGTLTREFGRFSTCNTQGTYIDPWVGPKERLHKLAHMREAFAPPHVRTGSWVRLEGQWMLVQAGDKFTRVWDRTGLDRGDFAIEFGGKKYVNKGIYRDANGHYGQAWRESFPLHIMVEGNLYCENMREDWTFEGREGLYVPTGHWWEALKDLSFDALPTEWRTMRSRIALPGEDPFTEGEVPAVEEATA